MPCVVAQSLRDASDENAPTMHPSPCHHASFDSFTYNPPEGSSFLGEVLGDIEWVLDVALNSIDESALIGDKTNSESTILTVVYTIDECAHSTAGATTVENCLSLGTPSSTRYIHPCGIGRIQTKTRSETLRIRTSHLLLINVLAQPDIATSIPLKSSWHRHKPQGMQLTSNMGRSW